MKQTNRLLRRFTPGRTGEAAPLGQLEAAVMTIVWSREEPISVGDVHAALPREAPVAYNTVKTTMERLAEKQILTRSRSGKAYLYRALVTREELERRIVTSALDRLVERFPEAVASFFTRPGETLSVEKQALLREAVERSREQRDA